MRRSVGLMVNSKLCFLAEQRFSFYSPEEFEGKDEYWQALPEICECAEDNIGNIGLAIPNFWFGHFRVKHDFGFASTTGPG